MPFVQNVIFAQFHFICRALRLVFCDVTVQDWYLLMAAVRFSCQCEGMKIVLLTFYRSYGSFTICILQIFLFLFGVIAASKRK